VVGVPVQLGPLVRLDGVLDGERMQPELIADLDDVLGRWRAQVDPDDGVGIGQVVGDIFDREVLLLQPSVAVAASDCYLVNRRVGRGAPSSRCGQTLRRLRPP
jgi:hypothetical protein